MFRSSLINPLSIFDRFLCVEISRAKRRERERKTERERELEKGNWILGFCENIGTRTSKLRAVLRGRESRDPSRGGKRGENPLPFSFLFFDIRSLKSVDTVPRIKSNGGIAARSETQKCFGKCFVIGNAYLVSNYW